MRLQLLIVLFAFSSSAFSLSLNDISHLNVQTETTSGQNLSPRFSRFFQEGNMNSGNPNSNSSGLKGISRLVSGDTEQQQTKAPSTYYSIINRNSTIFGIFLVLLPVIGFFIYYRFIRKPKNEFYQ